MGEWLSEFVTQYFILDVDGGMVHNGLPALWSVVIVAIMLSLIAYTILYTNTKSSPSYNLTKLPLLGPAISQLSHSPMLLVALRLLFVAIFLLVIAAGLYGTVFAERNIATVLTWTVWWTGVIISILFIGTAWCAVCPWDTIASWLVKRRLWRRGSDTSSLNIRVPSWLRNVWPATFMFIGLTWMELGVGITASPYATASLALLLVMMATLSMAFFERKAFCRNVCPIGRTIGAYSNLSNIKLSPIDENICLNCTTLECYHGTQEIDPCPTHLVMGRLKNSTYCTSCGACALSCPDKNVSWKYQANKISDIAEQRLNYSEAYFIIVLVALTSFHGVTMLPIWEPWMQAWGIALNDKSQLLLSFTLAMMSCLAVPVILYAIVVKLTHLISRQAITTDKLFSLIALPLLPLAFSYHIAHNLVHLVRESRGIGQVFLNPFGSGTKEMKMGEIHMRHMNPILPDDLTFFLQSLLIIVGFLWALRILFKRVRLIQSATSQLALATPSIILILFVTLFNLWLLLQPMVMRM